MKTNWKKFLFAAIAIIAVLAILSANHYRKELRQKEDEVKLMNAAKSSFAVAPIKTFTDKNGISHFQVPAQQNSSSDKAINEVLERTESGADTNALAIGILTKRVEDWKRIATSSHADNLKASVTIDSLKRKVRHYENEFISLTYTPGIDSTDNGTFNYHAIDKLTILQYWQPKYKLLSFLGKYGPQKSLLDISSANPFTTVTGFETFSVKSSPSNFNLKGQLRTAYDFTSGTAIPSVGVELAWGSFDLAGRYYYSQHNQRIQPIVSASWNFLNIK